MFARPAFSTSVGCIVLAMLALVGLELIAAQYLQLVLGLSPLETGLRLLPLTFAAMAAGLSGPLLLRRFGPRRTVVSGFCLTAAAVLVLTAMGGHDDAPLLLAGFVLLGFGLETTLFGAYESMLSEASAEQAGGAAAIGETSYQLGAGIGIALLGSVMNAAYAPGLASVPGVPAHASAAAGHSLGEAYEVAGRLGGERGELLRHAARHSFVHGLHMTLLVSAGLLLLGAVMAVRLPRVMRCAEAAAPTGGAVPAPRAVETPRVSAWGPPDAFSRAPSRSAGLCRHGAPPRGRDLFGGPGAGPPGDGKGRGGGGEEPLREAPRC
jgi:DHA2 family multidrug resistance protein-like MFS transporter